MASIDVNAYSVEMRFVVRLRRFFARFLAKPHVGIALAATSYAACMGAMTPRGKLDEAVQETALAARFGRHDVAMEHVAGSARTAFLKRHKLWGSDVRIVDVELGGLEKSGNKEAVVLVGFSWFRPNEGTLRTTVVRQTWKNDDGSGPWFLVEEERASGDVGLLGEPPVTVMGPAKEKAQFETTVIK